MVLRSLAVKARRMPTPLERINLMMVSNWESSAFEAVLKIKCASSMKSTSLGFSISPTSGKVL